MDLIISDTIYSSIYLCRVGVCGYNLQLQYSMARKSMNTSIIKAKSAQHSPTGEVISTQNRRIGPTIFHTPRISQRSGSNLDRCEVVPALFLKIWRTSSTKIATHGVFGRQKSKWQGFLNESTRKSSIWIINHLAIGVPPWLWKSQIGKPLNCIQGGSLTFLDPVKAALSELRLSETRRRAQYFKVKRCQKYIKKILANSPSRPI